MDNWLGKDSLQEHLKANCLGGDQENLFYFVHVHKELQVLRVKSATANL